jgi:hypothetical protein
MPVGSQQELASYIVEVLLYDPPAARRIAASASFVNKRFRGGGTEFVLFLDELGVGQFRRLMREFGYPRILWDHIPGPDGRCRPHDNTCCADYYGDNP